jgi:hypothetical protein
MLYQTLMFLYNILFHLFIYVLSFSKNVCVQLENKLKKRSIKIRHLLLDLLTFIITVYVLF